MACRPVGIGVPVHGLGAQLVSEAHISMVMQVREHAVSRIQQGGRQVSHGATKHPHGVGYVRPGLR
eukprot:5194786-Pleurochrysis_carterae.AAC.1